jgi:hypothetical protein
MREDARGVRYREFRLMEICDQTIVVSTAEKALLARESFAMKVFVIPLVFGDESKRPVPGFEDRSGIVFVGGYQHAPNVDAVFWFLEEIWPLVREELPDVIFHVVGSHPPPEILALNIPGVHVHGFVKNLDDTLNQGRVSIAPLRFGAGIKGKVGSSLAAGLPVVATTIAAEGMEFTDGDGVLVAENPQTFADLVVQLHTSRDDWERQSSGGRAFIRRNYSVEATRTRIRDMLVRARMSPFYDRRCPFTGKPGAVQLDSRGELVSKTSGSNTLERAAAHWILGRVEAISGVTARSISSLMDGIDELAAAPIAIKVYVDGDLPVLTNWLERANLLADSPNKAMFTILCRPIEDLPDIAEKVVRFHLLHKSTGRAVLVVN